jgi:hypothetical protein
VDNSVKPSKISTSSYYENKENGCVQNNHTIEDVIYDKLRILSLNVCGLVSKLKTLIL